MTAAVAALLHEGDAPGREIAGEACVRPSAALRPHEVAGLL